MATPHICHVDCELTIEGTRRIHMMYAAEPSSAAGRYQWELNRGILDAGRRAWRASGQGQSRACRVWDETRRQILEHLSYPDYPAMSLLRERAFHRLEVALFS
ncbi:hypothetical protein SEA_PAVLO_115 [Microbacterium phage Pavlo]|nr:hypothetical protein SEA_PAVLO_3 [Microbacterium phage Pavlo]UVG34171.1 hypothetical protein SEA_PAVLO_115 [Microbacterium phage Pavlo]